MARMVPLSESDVTEAARLLKILSEASDAVFLHPKIGGPQKHDERALIAAVRRDLNDRRRRQDFLPEAIFGEPAWDMLLLLYSEHEKSRLSIGKLAEEIRVPLSSAVRWVNYLQDKRLAQRVQHPTDLRIVHVELTSEGAKVIEAYYSETLTRTP